MKNITVTIGRGDNDHRFDQSYTVTADKNMSVLDMLDHIYENIDATIAYFSHEACRQTACGKCAVRVNGEVCLACGKACPEEDFRIDPKNDRIIRDLICESGGHTDAQ